MENINELENISEDIFKNILNKLEKDSKYIFCDECSSKLKEYFKILDEIREIKKNIKCDHKIVCCSNDVNVWYECIYCKNLFY